MHGNLDVSAELENVVRPLAFALVTTINLFNPKTLFVHSHMFDIEDVFRSAHRTDRIDGAGAVVCGLPDRTARGSKREGAIAGIIEHLTDSPRLGIKCAFGQSAVRSKRVSLWRSKPTVESACCQRFTSQSKRLAPTKHWRTSRQWHPICYFFLR